MGFGAMRLTGSAPFNLGTPSDRGRSIATLRRAVELGVNHIDTAAFYFSATRSANELINSALSPYPDDLVIAAKVGPRRDAAGEWLPAASPEQLRGLVEENLRQIGRDDLHLVYLRVQGPGPVTDRVAALARLRDEGLIRHLGISAASPAQLTEALAVAPIVSVQNRYGIGARREADSAVLQLCAEYGIAFVPFFSIAGTGAESGAGNAHDARLAELAAAHGATVAQIRLAWTLHQGPHVLAIPGTGNPDHLVENVGAAGLSLTSSQIALLDGIAGLDEV